jgi:hypothetical protein
LTIVTQPLNSAASNNALCDREAQLVSHSLLPIHQQVGPVEVWDEAAIARWRTDYNQVRPHGSLEGHTPFEFSELWEDQERDAA